MLHTGSIAPSHCSMHLCSITWIYGGIQGDALASFSWHREAWWCEEGTGPYATILGGVFEEDFLRLREGGWMNQWWVIRDPDRINGCFCITYLLTYIYKWDMELGFTNPVTNHWSTNFLGHRKSGRLVFFANMQSRKYVMNAVDLCVWCDHRISFSKVSDFGGFCCWKWSCFSVEGKYFSFEIGKWLIFVWNNRNVADVFFLQKWLHWLWEGKWRMVLGTYFSQFYRDMAVIFKVKKWLVFLSRYI